MRVRRTRTAAIALSMLGMLLLAPAANAECFPGDLPVQSDQQVAIGDAFLATVTEASNDVDANENGSNYAWHLELDIDAVYRGHAPAGLSFNGFERRPNGQHGTCVTRRDLTQGCRAVRLMA